MRAVDEAPVGEGFAVEGVLGETRPRPPGRPLGAEPGLFSAMAERPIRRDLQIRGYAATPKRLADIGIDQPAASTLASPAATVSRLRSTSEDVPVCALASKPSSRI
jgi:hypothetical protein